MASAYIHLSRWSGKCLYTSEQMEWQVPIYIRANGVASSLYTSEQMEWQVPIDIRADGVASAYIHQSRWSGKVPIYT